MSSCQAVSLLLRYYRKSRGLLSCIGIRGVHSAGSVERRAICSWSKQDTSWRGSSSHLSLLEGAKASLGRYCVEWGWGFIRVPDMKQILHHTHDQTKARIAQQRNPKSPLSKAIPAWQESLIDTVCMTATVNQLTNADATMLITQKEFQERGMGVSYMKDQRKFLDKAPWKETHCTKRTPEFNPPSFRTLAPPPFPSPFTPSLTKTKRLRNKDMDK